MKSIFYPFVLSWLLVSCTFSSSSSQEIQKEKPEPRLVGGPCEGCEAIFEYGQRALTSVDTLPEFNQADTQLKVQGQVWRADGKTPAEGVILYIYHTNQEGLYPAKAGATGWEKRHGSLRAWLQTDEQGSYTFYTSKPAPYPNHQEPAHIHLTILEPDGKYYYASDFLFAGDSLLKEKDKDPNIARAGLGVMNLRQKDKLLLGKRDIILGEHIPDYE